MPDYTPDQIRAALRELEQALMEMNHAYTNPDWFTKGEAGAAAQFRLWHGKGSTALRWLASHYAGMAEDAERYRWLRVPSGSLIVIAPDMHKGGEILNGDTLDAAIDAARKP